jgi:hypothetical protein
MNQINTSYKIGFPFSASTIEYLQGQILLLQQLSLVNGTNYIISGCVVTGGNTSNGKVVVNGEVLDFVGGATLPTVVITETSTNRQFEDLQIRSYYKNRVATFGTAGTTYTWADFERNSPTNGLLKRMRIAENLLTTLGDDLNALEAAFGSHTHTWASISNKPNAFIVYAASVYLGEVGAPGGIEDTIFTIPIETQPNTNYIVAGSLLGTHSTNLSLDNDVSWVVGDKQLSSFKLACREYSPVIQDLKFEFAIIKLN